MGIIALDESLRPMSSLTPIVFGACSGALELSARLLSQKASKCRAESSERNVPESKAPRVASSRQIAWPMPFVAPLLRMCWYISTDPNGTVLYCTFSVNKRAQLHNQCDFPLEMLLLQSEGLSK